MRQIEQVTILHRLPVSRYKPAIYSLEKIFPADMETIRDGRAIGKPIGHQLNFIVQPGRFGNFQRRSAGLEHLRVRFFMMPGQGIASPVGHCIGAVFNLHDFM